VVAHQPCDVVQCGLVGITQDGAFREELVQKACGILTEKTVFQRAAGDCKATCQEVSVRI
jgi:hypothetical protein